MKYVFPTLFFVFLFCVFIYTSTPTIYFSPRVEKPYPGIFLPQTIITYLIFLILISLTTCFIENFMQNVNSFVVACFINKNSSIII